MRSPHPRHLKTAARVYRNSPFLILFSLCLPRCMLQASIVAPPMLPCSKAQVLGVRPALFRALQCARPASECCSDAYTSHIGQAMSGLAALSLRMPSALLPAQPVHNLEELSSGLRMQLRHQVSCTSLRAAAPCPMRRLLHAC